MHVESFLSFFSTANQQKNLVYAIVCNFVLQDLH